MIEIRSKDFEEVTSFLTKKGAEYHEIGEIIKEGIEINSKKFDYFDIMNKYRNDFEKIIS